MDEATQVSTAEAMFATQWQGEEAKTPAPRSVLLAANPDDADLCDWLQVAEVGQEWRAGGGAAPECTIKRVS